MLYVCSDIHGLKNRYNELFGIVGDKDKLYILGDVIDRGPDGIEILQDIMTRDNVELLIGNHEDMMLNVTHPESEDKDFWFDIWCDGNGGRKTYMDFLDLSDKEKNEIWSFLENCSVFKRLTVEGRKFYLVHGCPVAKIEGEELAYKDLHSSYAKKVMLWDDPFNIQQGIELCDNMPEDVTCIMGHVFVQRIRGHENNTIYRYKNRIGIDGGCALGYPRGSLMLYCLNNDETIYIK